MKNLSTFEWSRGSFSAYYPSSLLKGIMKRISFPVLGLLWLMLAGCAGGPKRNQLVIANRGLPLCLTPHLKSEVISVMVQGNIFESLVEFDADMRIRPLLAASWENPDDLTWVFRLQPRVRFHDGSLMTAEDVVYSLNRARSYPASEQKSNFVTVDTIYQLDSSTIVIKTKRPYPLLLNKLTSAFIIPARYHQKYGDAGFEMAPLGTGPYRLQSFDRKKWVRLTRWESYWGPKPDFPQVVFTLYHQPDEIGPMLAKGLADIVNEVPPAVAVTLAARAIPGYKIERHSGISLRYLGIDTRVKPWSDPRVRWALSLGTDRKTLVEKYALGFGSPANQLVPQAIFGYHSGLPALEYDPQRARALLRAAGYGRGLKMTLLLPEARLPLGEELKSQWARIGIQLDLNARSREEFFQAVDTSSFYLLGSISISGDASDLFDDVIHSPHDGYGRDNYGRYRNARVDRLIEAAAEYLDQGQRLKALQELMRLVMQDLPRIPLYVEDEIYVVSSAIYWQPRLDMMVYAKDVNKR